MEKMTKREVMEYLLENFGTDEIVEDFANGEIELLDRRKANKKPTKVQIQNAKDKEILFGIIAESENPLNTKEIKALEPAFADYSSQKLTALLTQMFKDELIDKTNPTKRGELVSYSKKETE